MGYRAQWKLLNASDFGVPQLRPRAVMVALREEEAARFQWPTPSQGPTSHVGPALLELMSAAGWRDAARWAEGAAAIGPTLVGGSRKHGGPDLGPTRAREAWRRLGVDGSGLADAPPEEAFVGMPKLTVPMAAVIPRAFRSIGDSQVGRRLRIVKSAMPSHHRSPPQSGVRSREQLQARLLTSSDEPPVRTTPSIGG